MLRPEHGPCDLLTLLERERARAGSLKWHFDRSRSKLKATVEEAKELRRTTKYIPTLQAELGLLEQVLSEVGTEPSEHNAIGSVRMVIRRLRGILTRAIDGGARRGRVHPER